MLYREASQLLITLTVKATSTWTPQVTMWLHALQDYVTSVAPSAYPDIDVTLDVGVLVCCSFVISFFLSGERERERGREKEREREIKFFTQG